MAFSVLNKWPNFGTRTDKGLSSERMASSASLRDLKTLLQTRSRVCTESGIQLLHLRSSSRVLPVRTQTTVCLSQTTSDLIRKPSKKKTDFRLLAVLHFHMAMLRESFQDTECMVKKGTNLSKNEPDKRRLLGASGLRSIASALDSTVVSAPDTRSA